MEIIDTILTNIHENTQQPDVQDALVTLETECRIMGATPIFNTLMAEIYRSKGSMYEVRQDLLRLKSTLHNIN